MFFAQTANDVTLKTYLDILTKLVDNRDDTYKGLVDKIIIETARVSVDKKNLKEVDSSMYHIVSVLSESNGEYFARNIHSLVDITMDVYKTVRAFLSTLSIQETRNFSHE